MQVQTHLGTYNTLCKRTHYAGLADVLLFYDVSSSIFVVVFLKVIMSVCNVRSKLLLTTETENELRLLYLSFN